MTRWAVPNQAAVELHQGGRRHLSKVMIMSHNHQEPKTLEKTVTEFR